MIPGLAKKLPKAINLFFAPVIILWPLRNQNLKSLGLYSLSLPSSFLKIYLLFDRAYLLPNIATVPIFKKKPHVPHVHALTNVFID